MFEVRSEAHRRILSAVEDIKSRCKVRDDFHEWFGGADDFLDKSDC